MENEASVYVAGEVAALGETNQQESKGEYILISARPLPPKDIPSSVLLIPKKEGLIPKSNRYKQNLLFSILLPGPWELAIRLGTRISGPVSRILFDSVLKLWVVRRRWLCVVGGL
jgi:hypothetical protein